ncbi:MAG: hypothetical protein IJ300_11410 [Clostridia bacterium]|nr:hypothetical protein [Clostridia bacterium]
MNENKDNKNTKSLFLYTSLIFLVALLMIILSFFGQNHADKLKETEQRAQTITERASLLSDENLRLTNKITELEQKNEALTKELSEKTVLLENITIQVNNESKVIAAYNEYTGRKYKSAVEMVKDVNPDALTAEVKKLYDKVMQKAD